MKKKPIPRALLRSLCDDVHPEDGVDPRDLPRGVPSGRRPGKERALCHHVRRTLGLVLAGDLDDDHLASLEVLAVEPAPLGGVMTVVVRPDPAVPGLPALELLARLEALRPYLRQEVAASLHRKQAPDFSFVLSAADVDDA